MGLNEAAGYGGVAVTALATGYLAAAYGLRPAPFLLGAAYIALGLGLSAAGRPGNPRPRPRTRPPAPRRRPHPPAGDLTTRQVFARPASASPPCPRPARPGMVNNLNDGLAWGLFPVLFARGGLAVARSASSPPSTRPCGAPGSSPPAPCRTGSAANGSSPPAC